MKIKDYFTLQTGLVLGRYSRPKSHITSEMPILSLFSFSGTGRFSADKCNHKELSGFKEQYKTRRGDVLIRLRIPSEAIWVSKWEEGIVVPSTCAILRPLNQDIKDLSVVEPEYFVHWFNSYNACKRLDNMANVGSSEISLISLKDIANFEIIPPPLKKQKKIIDLIYLANYKIDLLQDQIELARKEKTAIIQNIFS